VVENAEFFRRKAQQCRRLAASLTNQTDPAVARMLALAAEFDARAGIAERRPASDPARPPSRIAANDARAIGRAASD
jgi:hypothetical protein